MISAHSKHDSAGDLNSEFAALVAPIQQERDTRMLEVAAEEVRGARILLARARQRLDIVGVDVTSRTDALLAADALEVVSGSIGLELGGGREVHR